MSLTLEKNLDSICPVDNPMELIISTDNHLSDPGTKAQLNINFNDIDLIEDHYIILAWGDRAITFWSSLNPDNTGRQIHSATIGQSVSDWVAILADDFRDNYYLSQDFDISSDSSSIRFDAKNIGADFTLTIEDLTLTGTSHNSFVTGQDSVTRDFYGIIVRLLSDGGDVIGEDFVTPDSAGAARFDLHDLFCNYLLPEFTWPQPSDVLHRYREFSVRTFSVRYAESFNREVQRLFDLPDDHYAALGGFDYKQLAALNGVSYSLLDFITSFKAFLTWQPSSKAISLTQKEKLFYLVFDDIKVIKSFVKLYFTDGTSSANQSVETVAVDQFKVFEFFTGYQALGISDRAGVKTVLKYDFWLEDDSGNRKSQVRTFEIDFRKYPYERIFIFRNSFGAFDVFRATGRKKVLNQYERLVLEKNISEISVTQQYQILENVTFQVNIGYVSKNTKNWLRELLLSEEVYEVIGNYKFPINIQNNNVDFFDDQKTIHDLDLEYKYSFKNSKYSDQVNTTPLLAENLNALLTEDGNALYAG